MAFGLPRLCRVSPNLGLIQYMVVNSHLDRFFGLFGVYYSLQYLSLSDATVLTFLAPMCTTVTGALLLKEGFSWKQAVAGRE